MNTETPSNIFHQKSLILLATTSTAGIYIPPILIGHVDELIFTAIGWMIAIVVTIFEYWTQINETPRERKEARTELYFKILLYTLVFIVLKFLHLWVVFDEYVIIGAAINYIVTAVYALIVLNEFKLVGINMELRYDKKHKIFKLLEFIESLLETYIIKKIEKTCNLDDKDKI